MGCFIVPAAEAVVTTVVTKTLETREAHSEKETGKVPFSAKLKHLNRFLMGGSALLAFEHVWHGELQPFFPFLTAASNPEDASQMLHEMSTVGVTMAVLVTAVWAGLTFVSYRIEKRHTEPDCVED